MRIITRIHKQHNIILYEHPSQIKHPVARFTERDILARRLVSPRSKPQMLISRPLAGK